MKNEIELNDSLILPCGAVLKNRLTKAALSENLAKDLVPGAEFENLYSTWAKGGIGLSITGNVMVDRHALGEPGNVVLDDKTTSLDKFRAWAKAGTQNETHLWMQLNHPGKQSPKYLSKEPVAPSAIAFNAPMDKVFNKPRELSEDEILKIIKKFRTSAKLAKDCGFTGVQIHAAHGYLISQFLSPLHNQRIDKWGGCLENRMRFLIEIYKEMREEVGTSYPIGVKLNSADFQRGGFCEEESIEVLKVLNALKVDLIEVSGGTYEASAMIGKVSESTLKREAYFLDYARKARKILDVPLMVTGGFRSSEVMKKALRDGDLDIVGLGRPVTIDPHFPNKILNGENVKSGIKPLKTGVQIVDKYFPLEITFYAQQMKRMAQGKKPKSSANIWASLACSVFDIGGGALKRTRVKS